MILRESICDITGKAGACWPRAFSFLLCYNNLTVIETEEKTISFYMYGVKNITGNSTVHLNRV